MLGYERLGEENPDDKLFFFQFSNKALDGHQQREEEWKSQDDIDGHKSNGKTKTGKHRTPDICRNNIEEKISPLIEEK